MLSKLQSEVDAAIERIASEGSVLDVNANVGLIVGAMRDADEHRYDEVALALIKAASRRQVAMTFYNQNV